MEESYRTGDLARMFGLTVRTIRYYEELGLLESGSRDGSNRDSGEHRRFPPRNLVYLRRIQQLKDYGLSLAEISDLFSLARSDRSGKAVRESLAARYREKLEEARRRRDLLDAHIADLSWHIEQLEVVKDFFQCPGAACLSCAYRDRCDLRSLLAAKEE